jgi:FKBP-type peptidyl-prolyl cis-trans isomerase
MPYAAAGSALADSVQLGSAHWSEAQLDAFMSGIRASYDGHGYPLDARSEHLLEAMTSQHPGTQAAQDGPGGQADRLERYMSRAREQLKMQQTASGLLFRVIARGEGPHPRPEDTVLISIKAKAPDGRTELPQLEAHQVRVKVGTLFPGMAEGLQLMALGGKMFFVIPPKLSFGDGKWPDGVDRGVPLWFEVELLDIVSP